MYTLSALVTLRIARASSLKDKRQVARSLTDRVRRRFNASVAEVDAQDVHRTLVMGVAVVSGERARAQNALEEIIRYIELNEDTELISAEVEG